MKLIKLTSHDLFVIVDDEDYEWLSRYNWNLQQNISKQYAKTRINGKFIYMHQLLKPSDNKLITPDHKNRNGLDNRKDNLRLANKRQQAANREKYKSRFKYKGVALDEKRNCWVAKIAFKGRTIYLGSFETEVEAVKKYNSKALDLFGEFAVLNEINEKER